jgi:hypothetical protein
MTTAAPPCVHKERIETPHGTETVKAVCENCGQEREYRTAYKSGFNVKETLQSAPQERVWDEEA